MSAISSFQDGLDVTRPQETTAEEIAAYRARCTGSNKRATAAALAAGARRCWRSAAATSTRCSS